MNKDSKPRIGDVPRTERFSARCTAEEKKLYLEFKEGLDEGMKLKKSFKESVDE